MDDYYQCIYTGL
jgi:PPOX class probable F420-dependent enzyme